MIGFSDPKKLYFFFDYISHNAYLAWTQVGALAQRHGLALEPVPVLFGAMLSHYRQVGPAEVPPKGRWMLWNVLRKAQQLGIPIAPPHTHPFNPLLALRVTCAVPAGRQQDFIGRLFRATWAESRPVSEEATVAAVVREAGLDAAAVLAQSRSDEVKQQLRANTDGALARGVFGVPTMLARGELFWGFDDFEYLELFLTGRDPLPADRSAYRPWLEIRPSIERKRP